jgi:putative glutamine amidotransferase
MKTLFMGRAGKVFFFEKKKQKTFVYLASAFRRSSAQTRKSFLVLFFKKERLSLGVASWPAFSYSNGIMDGSPLRQSPKPAIGVVADVHTVGKHTSHTVGEKYLDAITGAARAYAFILPARIDRPGAAWTDPDDFGSVLDRLDALFLTGAVSNVEPHRYGATLQDPDSPSDPARDHVTLPLISAAIARGMPILAVCRGFQEVNVALGGTLHQAVHQVPGLSDHREPKGTLAEQYAPSHEVSFVPGGLLHRFSGVRCARVNSLHGQGVDRLADSLALEATAPDGLIEAFSMANQDQFLLGVQWHPEWRFRDDPLSVVIFRAFGDAARAYSAAVSQTGGRPNRHGALTHPA